MSEYKIDKDVPVPEKFTSKYPFGDMEVNDSFFVEGTDKKTMRRLIGASNWASKRYPATRYSVRKVDGGVRVWRIE
jgi:hypothetical protein